MSTFFLNFLAVMKQGISLQTPSDGSHLRRHFLLSEADKGRLAALVQEAKQLHGFRLPSLLINQIKCYRYGERK